MPVTITVRNVPSNVRDELAARAAQAGQPLQEYLRCLLIEAATQPCVDDVIRRARSRVAQAGSILDREAILRDLDADRR